MNPPSVMMIINLLACIVVLNVRRNQIIKLVPLSRFAQKLWSSHHVSECNLEECVAGTPVVQFRKLVGFEKLLKLKSSQVQKSLHLLLSYLLHWIDDVKTCAIDSDEQSFRVISTRFLFNHEERWSKCVLLLQELEEFLFAFTFSELWEGKLVM